MAVYGAFLNIVDIDVKLLVLQEISQLSENLGVIELYQVVVMVRGSLLESLEMYKHEAIA